MAIMTPYRPRAPPKISTISIFMKVPLCAASVKAAPDPIIPTQIPQVRLHPPVMTPAANTPYAFLLASWKFEALESTVYLILSLFHAHSFGFDVKRIAIITP